MLETIAIILIILWLLGLVSGYTLGNFIYVLLVIAIVLFLVRLDQRASRSESRARGHALRRCVSRVQRPFAGADARRRSGSPRAWPLLPSYDGHAHEHERGGESPCAT